MDNILMYSGRLLFSQWQARLLSAGATLGALEV